MYSSFQNKVLFQLKFSVKVSKIGAKHPCPKVFGIFYMKYLHLLANQFKGKLRV